ncbi:MAG: copper resistance protein [Bradyrhizobiaceae bacterium]|nr:MAG: copper resistance protein [Bradyrhizobiaceae bacterium]
MNGSHPGPRAGRLRPSASLLAALLLGGCAGFSPDGGMDLVKEVAAVELGKQAAALRSEEDAAAARDAVARLLARTLTAETAVQVALLNNRGLQAAYNELGLAEAARLQASLPPNPTISVERISSSAEIEIEKRIVANILALLTLPARAEIASDRFRQAQLRAADETLRVAQEARRAYHRAVAARELAHFLGESQSAAEAASRLSQRLGESGAVNKLDQAREQVFYAELTAQLATARQRAASERERLARILGLWGADLGFRLPTRMPPPPARPRALPAIEAEAVARRLDLQIARIELAAVSRNLGLTQATRFVNLLELSGVRQSKTERETGHKERARGFELELQIPIFDGGEVRARQANETYLQAVNRLVDRAVSVRSEARDAYRTYRSTYDIAAHYRREVLPLRRIISEETLLRYNAMQIDVFALLAEARQRIAATTAAIDAQREFWLAETNLIGAVVGGGTAEAGGASAGVPMAAADAPGH